MRASTQLGRGETIADTARVLSRYVDAIMIRTDDHAKVEEMAASRHRAGHQRPDRSLAPVPDHGRPADRHRTAASRCPGSRWAWLGDGNNVLHSIIEAAGLMRFDVGGRLPRRAIDPEPTSWSPRRARGGEVRVEHAIRAKRSTARDVVVTDTWISMGQAHAETSSPR